MQRDELAAIGDLTADALAGVASQVHGVHEGIASRVWSNVGPLGAPIRVAHDVITSGVYAGVERSVSTLTRTGARVLAAAVASDAPSLQRSGTGRFAIGVLNGAVGDSLEAGENALALRTTLRCGGNDVEPTGAALRAAFPDATTKLAVFVHGFGETDDAWSLGAQRNVPYGPRLRRELGYTPVYVRYNSGRPVSATGQDLAALLARLSFAWPLEIEEIVLVGHAMGGSVARSACEHGLELEWRSKVSRVVTLGSPERGAPLERVAGAVSSAMARVPETRRLAATLGRRSAGMKELRSGGRQVPYASDVDHCFLDYRRLGPLRHLQLLNDPAVYQQLRARVTSPRTLPGPRAELPAPAVAAQRP